MIKSESSLYDGRLHQGNMHCKYLSTQNTSSQKYNVCSYLIAFHQNQIHRTNPDHSFLKCKYFMPIDKTVVPHSHVCECAHMRTRTHIHAQIYIKQNRNPIYMYVTTSPTFGCKSRCSQAWIKLSTIPSPNKPASTVSVTTKETLDKKKSTMKYNV